MADPSPLFRPESLESRRHSWLGRPMLLPSPSGAVFAVFSIVLVAALATGLVLGEYTQRVRVGGVLLPSEGLTRMVAPQSGWVTEVATANGARVRRGDLLYRISIDQQTALGDTQDAVAQLLRDKADNLRAAIERQIELDEKERGWLDVRVANLTAEIEGADEQIVVLTEFVEQTRSFAERQEDYVSRGISVAGEYQARLSAYHAERSQLARLKRERIQLESQRAEIVNQIAGFDLAAETRIAELRRQIIDSEQQLSEAEARRLIEVTAPRDGRVTGILTLAGQTVSAGTPLLTIVPEDKPLRAELLVPSSGIGFVREGSPVLLRYEAFPYQKFGQHPGRVEAISRTTLRPEELTLLNATATPDTGSVYRITVSPNEEHVAAYGQDVPLQAGMQVEAHILTDTRPLYQWILSPVYSLRGGLTGVDGRHPAPAPGPIAEARP